MFCIPAGRGVPAQRSQSHHFADIMDGESLSLVESYNYLHCYARAALYALRKHADAIVNISATQISAQLYSNCLISAETLSMISAGTNMHINKNQMLIVYDDLRSKIMLCNSGFVKFVDILRGYPEYEGLANDLQGLYVQYKLTI